MFRGFTTAIRTLSILPAPGKDPERMSASLPWFPLVGLGLGYVAWGTGYGVMRASGDWAAGAAALSVLFGVVVTRALHVDGLADWADAVGCMGDREKRLRVMKDPSVGAFGVAAIAASLLLKYVALSRLFELGAATWLVVAYVVSRAAQVELASALPYARAEGGTAGGFVAGAGWPHRIVSAFLALAAAGLIAGPAGLATVVAGLVLARLFGLWCSSRLGGVTGDALGAASELVETGILCVTAAAATRLFQYTGWDAVLRLVD